MYKSLALLNGAIIAAMILSNGIMVEHLGNTPSVLLNHMIGLTTIVIIYIATKTKWVPLRGIPFFYLCAGLTGLVTVWATNVAFLALGATITLMLSMFGRLVTSAVIDHYGLMGMNRYPVHPAKFIGLFLMVIGVVLIVIG